MIEKLGQKRQLSKIPSTKTLSQEKTLMMKSFFIKTHVELKVIRWKIHYDDERHTY